MDLFTVERQSFHYFKVIGGKKHCASDSTHCWYNDHLIDIHVEVWNKITVASCTVERNSL